MTIIEKYATEQNNGTSIHLYREGTFWRAYEMSAYLFVKHVKEYTVIRKVVKALGHNVSVAYIGFPDAHLNTLLQNLPHNLLQSHERRQHSETYVELRGFPEAHVQVFEKWKSGGESVALPERGSGAGRKQKVAKAELPLYKAAMELAEVFLHYVNDIPKVYRSTVVDGVIERCVELLSQLYLAATAEKTEEKLKCLRYSREHAARITVSVRLLHAQGALSNKAYARLIPKIDEVNRQMKLWSTAMDYS